MLFTFKTYKKKYAIHYQIEEFLEYRRRRVGTSKDHGRHLKQFIKITGVTQADDISEYDIRAYLEALVDREGTRFDFIEAQTAFRLFYIFVSQKGYLSARSRKGWVVTKKDRYGTSFIPPLQEQLEDDILYWPMSNEKNKGGRPRNENLRKEIAEKLKEGWTYERIGEHYNRAPSTVHELSREPRQKVIHR